MEALDYLAAGDLATFASRNGWRFDAVAEPPAIGGSAWEIASAGAVHGRVSGEGWEAGTLVGASGTSSETRQFGNVTMHQTVEVNLPRRAVNVGYLAITLPKHMPHLILDARANGRWGHGLLQRRPLKKQLLSLGGEFDQHFRAYAPKGYELDAFFLLSPALMALLIDETGAFDVEVRDDRMIVYRPGGFRWNDPQVWWRFARIRATVGALGWRQADGYSDVRVPGSGAIGPEGRRLQRGLPALVWIFLAVSGGFLALWALPFLAFAILQALVRAVGS